jgi:RHS repeat-associated protein
VHDRTYERFGASGAPGDAFEYDKLRRLTVAWIGSSTPTSPPGNPYVTKIQYNMDDDGNRTSVVTTPYGGSASTSSYSTNSLNEYTSVGGTSQSSDANGNLTDNGTYLFVYDYRNHIVQVKLKSSGAVIASYRYDALGRRVEKNVGGTVERHILSIWNDPGVVEDLSHVVSVYDGSDAWKQNFVWSDEVDGIQMLEQKDTLDYDTDGNTTEVTRSFYHPNALGSVMEITDMNQAVVVSYRYDPYGKVTITRGGTPQSSDPLGQHWTFTGRFLDEEAGLLYYRARYYDPATGRFLQRDPLGYDTGPSLFAYCESNPANTVDPEGLDDFRPTSRAPAEVGEAGTVANFAAWRDKMKAAAADANHAHHRYWKCVEGVYNDYNSPHGQWAEAQAAKEKAIAKAVEKKKALDKAKKKPVPIPVIGFFVTAYRVTKAQNEHSAALSAAVDAIASANRWDRAQNSMFWSSVQSSCFPRGVELVLGPPPAPPSAGAPGYAAAYAAWLPERGAWDAAAAMSRGATPFDRDPSDFARTAESFQARYLGPRRAGFEGIGEQRSRERREYIRSGR